MRRRTRLTILVVLLIAALLAAIVALRSQAPPEPARLLPGADAFVYLDLKWVRRIGRVGPIPTVPRDPDYEQFIRETGFQFERDLDEAAFAVHYTPPLAAPDGSPRFTEVLTGHWNSQNVAGYLRKIGAQVEDHRGVDIFSIPLQGRTLRVAMLSPGTVAISNTENPEIIRRIIDRSRKLASPFGGPALLRSYYRHVPFGSLAWAIVSNPAQVQSGPMANMLLPLDYRQLLSGSVIVASVRFLRAIHVRAEAFFTNEAQASQLAEKLGALLTIFHDLQPTMASGGTDQDVKVFFDSLQMRQSKNEVMLTAVVPVGFLKKVFSEPPLPPAPPAPPPEATTHTKHRRRHKPRSQ